ncbi:TRAP transporter substrate-binding protein DctP [Tistrella mobilis]|uniref:C4-dicarboxylate-binding periplasmic protein n=2 Tax=Tistrella mobilis TaxID=171437 RepID=I3TIB5_TISMK|nr:TRAP transporter substrate-binding protein DctP [Tistrella mobilis]AFK52503.1 c4-dicarboxylate-binding periplasmic protein [Tistrella mobilis KA081020-065]MAM76948.1 C4-dicarboxylate ABC transporter [Tistrella sp.]
MTTPADTRLSAAKRPLRKHLAGLLSAAAFAVALVAGQGADAADPVVMRISHQLPPAHHIAQLIDQFAADVEAKSNGAIDVQIFGAEQAYKANQNHPAVARGQVEAAVSTNFQWGNTIPEMNVVTLPYFFTKLERIEKFPGSPAEELLDQKLLEKGVRNIAWFYTTRQSIFTSAAKPLVAVDDFKGIKIRGLNKLVDEGLIAAGAAPAAMPGSEVYQALQTGVIDAGLTDVSAAYSRRFYEVQKYGTVSPFFSVYFHLYVNPSWYDGLAPELRKVVDDAAQSAEAASIPLTEKTAEDAIRQLQEKGMTIHVQTPEEAAAFEAVMQPPVMEAFKASSPDAAKLVDLVNAL